jgi:hypothetical protein
MYSNGRAAFAALLMALAFCSPALAKTRHHAPPGDGAPASALAPDAGDPDAAADADLRRIEAEIHAWTASPSPGVAERLAAWAVASGDSDGQPFMVVDKLGARVFAFDADGRLLGSAPVLVGLAPGDDSAPGVGDLALAAINPDERTTPAGRFDAAFGPSNGHGTVFWVDYADGIGLHPVITTNPAEHRLQRIKSPSPQAHRISFGCINVPAKFYADFVQKHFAAGGVVYVLPDTKPLDEVFPAFAAAASTDAEVDELQKQDSCADASVDIPARIPDAGLPPICTDTPTAEASAAR